MYKHSCINRKAPDQFGKLLIQMCNTRIYITNDVPLWHNNNGFTSRKHNGNSVIDYVLLYERILDHVHKFLLGEMDTIT